ncbi:MAG: hypothetical protein ACI9MR_001657 [Myxococcota bacterium]|jgi:hypothetical protein
MTATTCLRTALAAVLFFASATLLTGCDEEEFFEACPLSESILEICEAESANTTLSCVVQSHPQCVEDICAKWEDSEPFCSRVCAVDTDCPAASACESYLEFRFCVPDEILNPVVAE